MGLGAIEGKEVSFIKLRVSGDIQPIGGEIKATKPFIRRIVTQENARNAARGKFVRHIITQTRINTTTKRMKILIIWRRAIEKFER